MSRCGPPVNSRQRNSGVLLRPKQIQRNEKGRLSAALLICGCCAAL
jgi:hypothetical protein